MTDATGWLDTPPPLPALCGAPEPARAGNVRIGTASWTDRTLLDSGTFYPPAVRRPEQRLRYYARHFSMVEVDASYYAIPSEQMARAWVERTPEDFLFGIKAHAALTLHPFEPRRLDAEIQASLPAHLRLARRLYVHDLPAHTVESLWQRFLAVAGILHAARKLGYVLFQMPPWFRPTADGTAYLARIAAAAEGLPTAVEFRQPLWMAERHRERTLELLRRRRLAYVCVDEPQGTRASVPPVADVTVDDLAVVRFHGRRQETWARPGVGVAERFRYLYTRDELGEWVPRIHALARRAGTVHVVMNNCYREYGVQNAKDMAALLAHGA
jgi:uncharacterized protein YecE (DUF72 family)